MDLGGVKVPLRTRLTWEFAAFSLVPLAIAMGVGYWQSARALKTVARERLAALGGLKVSQMLARTEQLGNLTHRLQTRFSEHFDSGAVLTSSSAQAWLDEAGTVLPESLGVTLLDLNARVLASRSRLQIGSNWSDPPFLEAGRLQTRPVGPHLHPGMEKVVAGMAYAPLRTREGMTVGELAINEQESVLERWLAEALPQDVRVRLVTLRGRVLGVWPPETGETDDVDSIRTSEQVLPGGGELRMSMPTASALSMLNRLAAFGALSFGIVAALVVVVARALGRRIDTQEEMLRVRMVHQEKMATVGALAAGIAHEIGNPLASLSSIVQMRIRRAADDKEQEDLGMLLAHLERIERSVKNLTRMARHGGSGRRQRVFLQDLVPKVIQLVSYDPRARGVEFSTDLDTSILALELDEDGWVHALLNLLVNALDAVAETEDRQIVVTTSQEGSVVTLSVKDSGCGMSQETLRRAGQPAFTTKPPGSGTGLGLHLVKQVAGAHEGALSIESKLGEGTTVRVTIPTAPRPSPAKSTEPAAHREVRP